MNNEKFKVIILTHGGAKELLEELSNIPEIEVTAVFLELITEPQRSVIEKLRRSLKYDGFTTTLHKFVRFILGKPRMANEFINESVVRQAALRNVAENLEIPMFEVENFHLPEVIRQLRSSKADLAIIYGTNIIKESVFSIPRLGCVNIHKGYAPFYRGGPTVFWELMNNEDKIGLTVHFVAPQVDTGDIVRQTFVDLIYDFDRYGLDYEKFLIEFRASLVEPSAELMASAVREIANGRHQSIPQDNSLGTRYRIPTKREKDELKRRLKARVGVDS